MCAFGLLNNLELVMWLCRESQLRIFQVINFHTTRSTPIKLLVCNSVVRIGLNLLINPSVRFADCSVIRSSSFDFKYMFFQTGIAKFIIHGTTAWLDKVSTPSFQQYMDMVHQLSVESEPYSFVVSLPSDYRKPHKFVAVSPLNSCENAHCCDTLYESSTCASRWK